MPPRYISAYASADVLPHVRDFLPLNALVHTDWLPFTISAPTGPCVIVALTVSNSRTFHALAAGMQYVQWPIVLALPFERLRKTVVACDGADDLTDIGHVAQIINSIVSIPAFAMDSSSTAHSSRRSIRVRMDAFRQLSSRILPSTITADIIKEILCAAEHVRSIADLAARLGHSPSALRYHWRRDVQSRYTIALHRFVRWGRLLRVLEQLEAGHDILDIAVCLGVDESTLYRDLATLLGLPHRKHTAYSEQKGIERLLTEFGCD